MQVTVGRIGRPHGIRGEVVVGVRTDEPELRFAVGSRLDTDRADFGPLTLAAVRWQSGELIVRFNGIRDRTAASELRGTWLSVDSGTLAPPEDPDEFRDHDLIGLSVRTADGTDVGVVTDVLHHGQDVLTVRPIAGSPGSPGSAADGPSAVPAGATSGEILVPFVKAIVTDVDIAAGVVVIDPPPGLLNLEEAL
jgi:16S rRNA processing protein RimM